MSYQGDIRITLKDSAGDYYSAVQNRNNTWTVTTDSAFSALNNLPMNWQNIDITWERNMTYFGVFRSQSNKMEFTLDGRAILLDIMAAQGTSGYCLMEVWLWNETAQAYEKAYVSEVDFSDAEDDKVQKKMIVSTLDSQLYTLLKSKANSSFDLPFWTYEDETWSTDANYVEHDGIKLLWGGYWVSAATATSPILPQVTNDFLYAFNHGSTSDGRHWIPALNNYAVVQNNGTATKIGNDILEAYLPLTDQAYNYNQNFEGVNDLQAYTRNAGLFKDLLPNSTGSVDITISVVGKVDGGIGFTEFLVYTNPFVGIVLFEIGEDNLPVLSGGNYQYQMLYQIDLPNSGSPYFPPDSGNFSAEVPVTINYNKCYAIGIIYDDELVGISGYGVNIALSKLEVSTVSEKNNGTSTPVNAPKYPVSYIPTFTPFQVLSKLVNVIDSTETSPLGFPIPTGVGFSAVSTFLNNDSANPALFADMIAANCWWTSENAIRAVKGIPYMSISLFDLYQFYFKTCMCGLGIEDDNTTIRIEQLTYWFDKDTEILDLGDNIANFRIKPISEMLGNIVNTGFGELRTNNNFGVDAFAMATQYNLPLDKTPKTLEYSVGEAIVEIYEIEKMRAQNNSNTTTSSANNNCVVLETKGVTISEEVNITNPVGESVTVDAYVLNKYPTAQSTNPLTTPYLKGMYYPDSAYNLAFTPASNMRRLGNWLRSLCDGIGDFSGVASWRKVYQKQYNDYTSPATTLPGISKRLTTATVISEVKDIPISDFGSKLFRPYIFEFTSGYPAAMYELVNTNPRGYVSFNWEGIQYQGFIYKVTQQLGNRQNTQWQLIAHPLTTNAQLRLY
jgi:hypothetical protein